jgi:hypothetical protein
MSESSKWKNKLLSSSVPLEYEASQILVSQGYSVEADYSYARSDSGSLKDFSVDIYASSYFPLGAGKSHISLLELLIECKHRHKNNKWLFFPDPNASAKKFTGAPLLQPGATIRAVENFSSAFLPMKCTSDFEKETVCCIKGVEIDINTGNVHESEIKHGLSQLQYALPRLMLESSTFSIGSFVDAFPFFFCPILLTTSDIYVTKEEVSISHIEASQLLEDFSRKVPYLIVHSPLTPDFRRHRMDVFSELNKLYKEKKFSDVEEKRKAKGGYLTILPCFLCEGLSKNSNATFPQYFSQIVVCSLEHFPELIKKINKLVSSASRRARRRMAYTSKDYFE